MRKRLYAIHSDTTEEFEKLALQTENQSLIFYNTNSKEIQKCSRALFLRLFFGLSCKDFPLFYLEI